MRQIAIAAAALAALTLAACQASGPVSDNAGDSSNLNAVLDQAGQTANDAHAADNAADNAAATPDDGSLEQQATAALIPAEYQGRWGMVPADCTSTRGDAKGLITIDSKTIKFYESRATLKERRPAIATSFAGLFAFTGEGQEWTRVETLTRAGDRLKRADEEGSYDYTRCS